MGRHNRPRQKIGRTEEEGGSNEVHAVSFYPKPEPVDPLERKALENRLKPTSIEPPKLELKELPKHLEYAFLQENKHLPVVIASALSATEKNKLLKVLRNHKGAIAWSIADIKGRFIKDFSQVTRPMTQLLVKDAPFNFSKECKQAFDKLKQELTRALIMIKPDWLLPFEIMCNGSDYAVEEFDIEIHYKKGAKNLVADHLSRPENPDLGKLTKAEIRDLFLEE
ncbi:hypothetical protein Tco_1170969 [Tanacetum coccineum]